MIVHSARNTLGCDCLVQVEDARSETEAHIRRFAEGAAGLRNTGYRVASSFVQSWLDEDGRSLAAHEDTTAATGAIVRCTVVEP